MARVKTSMRRPCYLSKEEKRRKKQGQQIHYVKLLAGVLWRRGSLSTQSQGSSSCSQDTSPSPPPRILIFSKVCAILLQLESSTGRRRFSTGKCRVSTGRCRYSTGRCRLSTGMHPFYRKRCISTGSFL